MDPVKLGPREQQIVDLLLVGCDNQEIANQLHMARRTVKAHFNRLFLRFGIVGGIKRVKLATLLYRRRLEWDRIATEPARQQIEKTQSSNSLLPASKTKKLQPALEPPSTSLKTISESSTTSSVFGIEPSWLSGTKRTG